MLRFVLLKIIPALVVLSGDCLFSQINYQFNLNKTNAVCDKATAHLEVAGHDPNDTITLQWSTGESDVKTIHGLDGGNYSVNVRIRHWQDSLLIITDTTISFSIEKELCPVAVDKYFSPNDDDYHDKLYISNIQFYPDFELHIYNKWGQKIHTQKKTYIPWDGKWGGIDLPDGTYYYVLFYNSSDKGNLIKGDITILR